MGDGEVLYVESIRGYNYMSPKQIAKEFEHCVPTVRKRIGEIQEEIRRGRYIPQAVLTGVDTRVNVYVWIDYMAWRTQLMEKNLRKQVPPFTPEVARSIAGTCGYFQKPVTVDEALLQEHRERSMEIMLNAMRGGAA